MQSQWCHTWSPVVYVTFKWLPGSMCKDRGHEKSAIILAHPPHRFASCHPLTSTSDPVDSTPWAQFPDISTATLQSSYPISPGLTCYVSVFRACLSEPVSEGRPSGEVMSFPKEVALIKTSNRHRPPHHKYSMASFTQMVQM